MDRMLVYPGAVPLETDILNTNRNILIALGMIAQEIFGTGTVVNGLACTPNSPAALNAIVGVGRIYSLQSVDATAYSTLAADTTHQIMKQGMLTAPVTLSTPAPGTVGQSINYLFQATFASVDTNSVVLPYYNAANPQSAWAGPGNSGTAQNTTRQGQCQVTVKAGLSAPTGTQVTPAPDTGYVGLWVVTVAYGQTTVTSGNIAQYSGAPFISAGIFGTNPAFSYTPTAPTMISSDSSAHVATTQFVAGAIASALSSYQSTVSIAAEYMPSTTIAASYAPMVSGTRVTFQQSTVPTGWTIDTTLQNDSLMRFVQPASYAGTGGSQAFTTWNGLSATGAHTLTTAEMPNHNHSATGSDSGHTHGPNGNGSFATTGTGSGVAYNGATSRADATTGTGNANISVTVNANGGGGSHTHPLTNGVKYVDLVIGTKV